MSTGQVPAAALHDFLRARLPADADVEVSDLCRLAGGSSQENWAFEARWTESGVRRTRQLLLRRDPGSGVVDTDRMVEFALLQALAGSGLPVAHAYWADDGQVLGRPGMVVQRLAGRADRAVLTERDPLGLGRAGRLGLARQLPGLLAAVHAVDVGGPIGAALAPAGAEPARAELDRWVAELDRVEPEPQPALRFVAVWLRENLPPAPERSVLVHGDFRPANVLVRDGAVEALLDWELAHVGDPVDDLGWYTCSVYRREHFVGGDWSLAEFVQAYEAASGTPVEAGRLRFWQVLSTFRLAVIALTGVGSFLGGGTDRPAAPADRLTRRALADTGLVGAA